MPCQFNCMLYEYNTYPNYTTLSIHLPQNLLTQLFIPDYLLSNLQVSEINRPKSEKGDCENEKQDLDENQKLCHDNSLVNFE